MMHALKNSKWFPRKRQSIWDVPLQAGVTLLYIVLVALERLLRLPRAVAGFCQRASDVVTSWRIIKAVLYQLSRESGQSEKEIECLLKEGDRQLHSQFVETLNRIFPGNPYGGLDVCPCCETLLLVDAFEIITRELVTPPSSLDPGVMFVHLVEIMSKERQQHTSLVVRQLERGKRKAKRHFMALLDREYPGRGFELAHCEWCGVHHLMTAKEVHAGRCDPKIPD